MTISYPLAMPTVDNNHSTITWRRRNINGLSQSPFNGMQTVNDWDGSAWGIDVSVDRMSRAEAQKWVAFLTNLRGRKGTFYYGDVLMATPQGAAGGTPRVKLSGQVGFSLNTDGWPNSTEVLKAGDRIMIDNSIYMIGTDTTSDGSGNATLDVWPSLREHADNALIQTSNAKGLFRLDSDEFDEPIGREGLWVVSFSAIEAI